MYLQQISLFVENKAGRFAEITELLCAKGIDIRALSVADTTDYGIVRLIVNNPESAAAALRDAGLAVSLTSVLAIGVEDRPGGLTHALRVLADNDVSVEYMYAFISREENRAYVVARVGDNERAEKVLNEAGIPLLDGSVICGM